jgi:hypothetical protein
LIRAGTTGEVFRSGQVGDLVAAMVRVLRTPNDEARRSRCRQQVAGYTVTHAAEGLARAYASVVGLRAGMPRNDRELAA